MDEHINFRSTVDLLNLFQWLAFEEMEPIVTDCQCYWQILQNKLKMLVVYKDIYKVQGTWMFWVYVLLNRQPYIQLH